MNAIPLKPFEAEQVLQEIVEQAWKDVNNANLALRALGLQVLNPESIEFTGDVYYALDMVELTESTQVDGESITVAVSNNGNRSSTGSSSNSGRVDSSATTPPGQTSVTSQGGGDSSSTDYEYE